MNRVVQTLILVAVLVAFASSLAAQGRGGRHAHPAQKRVSFELLKKAIAQLDALEQKLEGRKDLGPKQIASIRLEIKEARLSVREFLMDMENRKDQLPAYECCPCRKGHPEEGKLEVNVNIQGAGLEPVGPSVTEIPAEIVVEPMATQSFDGLLSALKEQGFADDKLSVLQTAAKDAWFTVEQVKTLLKMFSFPDDKLSALRMVANAIVDPENKFMLFGSFVHSSDKEEAKRILEAN
jgi:hypothetical protein